MDDFADVLRRAFPGLEGDGFEHLLSVARRRSFPADSVIIRESEAGQTFFVILEGRVEITKRIDGETERVLQQLGPGEFFGEMALILTSPRTASVRTLSPSTLVEISKYDFDAVLSRHPVMALTVMRKLTQRLRRADYTAIAELRQKNQELERAYRELREQEQLRSELLTTIAHELRTPLTSANGYLTLISAGKVDGEQVYHAIGRSLRNVRRVVKLVNDILFLHEMDLILPEFQPVSVRELISQAVAAHGEQAIEADLTLRLELDEGPLRVMGDPEWLHRAIDALLDNAVKFSPDGGEISIRAAERFGSVQLAITDQGVGIPPGEMVRIFERFHRIQQVGPHLFGGVGLGLPVVKQVVTQHGGTIEVHSLEGQGSTFTISLPAAN